MYEDDGLTREHRKGVFATTKFEVHDNRSAGKGIEIVINPAKGDFTGRLKQRVYLLEVHSAAKPKEIKAQGSRLKAQKQGSRRKAQGSRGEWSFDPNDRGGILKIWTGVVSTDAPTTITLL